MIDYRIKTFLMLCDTMNYRKTAELLNMTQPAVTQHIHFLENEYKCKLFLYDRHTLKITNEGELLKNYAENVLFQEQKLFEKMKIVEQKVVRIGATKTIGEYVIDKKLAEYLKNPNNNLLIDIDNTVRLLQRLKKGELDFALIEGFYDGKEFVSKVYKEEDFIGVCSCNHPFANKTIPLEDTFSETLFIREKGSGTRTILEQILSEQNYTTEHFKRSVCVSNFGLMSKLICENIGVTFAYKAFLKSNPQLSPFYIEGHSVVRNFRFVYLNTPDSLKTVESFENILD